ncbi:MAG: hypothetical protein AB1716_05930 [Planctomycetota bacterium]
MSVNVITLPKAETCTSATARHGDAATTTASSPLGQIPRFA